MALRSRKRKLEVIDLTDEGPAEKKHAADGPAGKKHAADDFRKAESVLDLRMLLMEKFWEDVIARKPSEAENKHKFLIPRGSKKMDDKFAQFLHWCPDDPRKPLPKTDGFGNFVTNNWSIKFVLALFPEAEEKHAFHDFYSKATHMYDENGVRRSNHALYGEDVALQAHKDHARRWFETHEAEVFVVHRTPAKRFVLDEFMDGAADDGRKRWEDIMIGDVPRTVVFLPHPEYMQRWADVEVLKDFSAKVEELWIHHDVVVDLSAVERRIQKLAGEHQKLGLKKDDPVLRKLKQACIPKTDAKTLLVTKVYWKATREYYRTWVAKNKEKMILNGTYEDFQAKKYERNIKYYSSQTPDQRKARLEQKRKGSAKLYQAKKLARGTETPDQRKARLKTQKENETPDQRKARLEQKRKGSAKLYQAKKLARGTETPDQRKARLKTQKENETPAQEKVRKAAQDKGVKAKKLRRQATIAKETPDEAKARKKKYHEDHQKQKDKKMADKKRGKANE